MEKSISRVIMIALAVIAFATLPAHRAAADDESGELEFKVEGPLDAADCTAQTISVLGFTVAIAQARISGGSTGTCDDLGAAVGQTVEVELAGDITNAAGNLKAGKVDLQGSSNDLKIKGAIQAIAGKDITLLGRNVDIRGAELQGLDDKGTDSVPANFGQLAVGQFVEVNLVSSTPPLTAHEVEIENFTNEIEVELLDDNGVDFNDSFDDVDIEVRDHVLVKVPAHTSPLDGATVRRSKTRHYHSSSNGSFKLHGLFTGKAKLIIEREHDGQKSRATRRLRIRGDKHHHETVRLHRVN
jgi:hypothetical protein